MKNKKTLIAIMLIVILAAALIFSLLQTGIAEEPGEGGAEAASRLQPIGPAFNADSAMAFCAAQCEFGPRIMNSEAHEQCGRWIARKFRGYGLEVIQQRANVTGYDGTILHNSNIIASYKPEQPTRILICAHWDSRPWADNDPDSANWRKPVMAANDGASGVAVMLELARLLTTQTEQQLAPSIGVDFICFDAEDWGTPQWSDADPTGDTWALGAQYWAAHPHHDGYKARFGILLDMVGGQGARFYQEGVSMQYAPDIVRKVWKAARTVGFGNYFPRDNGGFITDDHVPVNQQAHIPTIDIIAYYPDCPQGSFGPTWHTVADDMEHLDINTLQAVGQTLVQVLYSEK